MSAERDALLDKLRDAVAAKFGMQCMASTVGEGNVGYLDLYSNGIAIIKLRLSWVENRWLVLDLQFMGQRQKLEMIQLLSWETQRKGV